MEEFDTYSFIGPQVGSTAQWYNQGAAPVKANELQTGTQALQNNSSINLENAAGSGFASSSQGPYNSAFGTSGSTSSAGTPGGSSTGLNSGVGNNASTTNTGNTSSAVDQSNQQVNSLLTQSQGSTGLNAQKSSGSSSSTGLPGSIGSYLKNLVGLKDGLTSGINEFGTGLGFGTGSSALGAIADPLAEAAGIAPGASSLAAANAADVAGGFTGFGGTSGALTSTSLSGVLGGAGIGALGGGLIAGFTGGNQLGGSIGGGIGGALGAAAAGTEIGASLGAFGGPLGIAAGTVIGGLVGGAFGNSTPATSTGAFAGNLTASGAFDNVGYASKNGSEAYAQSLEGQFSNLFSSASSALNIQFDPSISLYGGYNTLYSGNKSEPGFIDVNGVRQNFTPGNPEQMQSAAYNTLLQAATDSGYTNQQALYNWYYGISGGANTASAGYVPIGIPNAGAAPSSNGTVTV